jgi:hypothetical protein
MKSRPLGQLAATGAGPVTCGICEGTVGPRGPASFDGLVGPGKRDRNSLREIQILVEALEIQCAELLGQPDLSVGNASRPRAQEAEGANR